MKAHKIEAYIVLDYLLTAATRLRIHDPLIFNETRAILARYPDMPDKSAALAFIDALEREAAREDRL